jgi:hypothetical protein
MKTNWVKQVWGYDPKWIRMEAVDELGQSLGMVRFEPNPMFRNSSLTQEIVLDELWTRLVWLVSTVLRRLFKSKPSDVNTL